MKISDLKAGIIAAGDGARLQASFPETPKPLVPVAGRPLGAWVVQSLAAAGIAEVTVLVNSRGAAVPQSLVAEAPGLSWRFAQRDTATSWESFRLVCTLLAPRADEFLISTVDALVAPKQVEDFVEQARRLQASAALALTDFVDDEKPLWADLGAGGLVTALGAAARERRHATAGLYFMRSELASRLPAAAAHAKLRDFWSGLLERGERVAGVPIAKTLDVDRPEDVSKAEVFIKEALLC